MITMTVVAGGCRKILYFQEGLGVHAAAPPQVLIHRHRLAISKGVLSHALGIGMALPAGFGYPRGVDGGLGTGNPEDSVNSVTIHTSGDLGVPSSQRLAMPTGPGKASICSA